jgi:hypothetical protein
MHMTTQLTFSNSPPALPGSLVIRTDKNPRLRTRKMKTDATVVVKRLNKVKVMVGKE